MKFIELFEKKVKQTIEKYKLTNKKEKIIVACSGGKDSTTALYLLNKFGYNTEALHIYLGIGKWSEKNLANVKKICERLEVKLHIIPIKKEIGKTILEIRENKCRICSINKRYLLNKKARELGGKKLVMGHNLDDEAESIMMNLFKGNVELGLGTGPKTGLLQDKKFVQRIKPLFFCRNEETKKYAKLVKLPILIESCPCSTDVFRRKIRNWLNAMEKKDKKVKENVVHWFLARLPELRKRYTGKDELKYCERCGEPSRRKICKRCELMKLV